MRRNTGSVIGESNTSGKHPEGVPIIARSRVMRETVRRKVAHRFDTLFVE